MKKYSGDVVPIDSLDARYESLSLAGRVTKAEAMILLSIKDESGAKRKETMQEILSDMTTTNTPTTTTTTRTTTAWGRRLLSLGRLSVGSWCGLRRGRGWASHCAC